MSIMVNGIVLVCALCPALADAGAGASVVIAVTGVQGAETSNDAPDVDPRAVAELEKMIAELERYDKVIFKTRTTREAIQESGIKLHFDAEQEIGIHRPNKLYSIVVQDDGRSRRFWFDRSTASFLNVTNNEYVQVAVPPTINKMLDNLIEKSDLPSPPMLDFLYSDMETSFLSGLQSAWYVGESTIGSKKCHHLAFTQEGVDFQMWIPTTGPPLPVKYTITWTDEPQLPSFTARFTEWNTAPSFAKDAFSFVKPNGAIKIDLPNPTSEGN